MMNEITKSEKTQSRIEVIRVDLEFHQKNIALLKSAYQWHVDLKKHPYKPRAFRYSSLPKNENVFNYTLRNLKDQVALLECELSTLIEYGM